MKDVLVQVVPRYSYWLLGILVYPAASFIFTAVTVVPLSHVFSYRVTPVLMTRVWAAVTGIVAVWAFVRDYRRLSFTLTSTSLLLGRRRAAIVIPFEAIDSMVLSLPAQLPWWFRLLRFHPVSSGSYHFVLSSREFTILLRLRGNRYLPLCLAYSFLPNGDTLMREL